MNFLIRPLDHVVFAWDRQTDRHTESSEYRPDPPAAAGLVKIKINLKWLFSSTVFLFMILSEAVQKTVCPLMKAKWRQNRWPWLYHTTYNVTLTILTLKSGTGRFSKCKNNYQA
jgi:hypothetical protein